MFKSHWHVRFLEMAKHVSAWSKDPSTKCGSIVVDKYGTVISQGYNGFPVNMADTDERYEDRVFKYNHVIHAEMNALINARQSLIGHAVYVWPMMPCIRCASVLAQSQVDTVVSAMLTKELKERWGDSIVMTKQLFSEVGIKMIEIDGDGQVMYLEP